MFAVDASATPLAIKKSTGRNGIMTKDKLIKLAGQLQKDLDEQCLLLGKSGSREAELLADLDRWKKCAESLAYIIEEIPHRFVGQDEVLLALGKYRQLKAKDAIPVYENTKV
jgi:hypothetical protein